MGKVWEWMKSLPPTVRHALLGAVVAILWYVLDTRLHLIPEDIRQPILMLLAALGFGVVRQGNKQDFNKAETKLETVEHKLDLNTEMTAATRDATDGMKDQLVHEVRTASLAKGKEDERIRQETEGTEGE